MGKKPIAIISFIIITILSFTGCTEAQEIKKTETKNTDHVESHEEVKKQEAETKTETGNHEEFQDFTSSISSERMLDEIKNLCNEDVPRLAGSSREATTGEYINKEFEALGLSTTQQEFPFISFKCDKTSLTLLSDDKEDIECKPLEFSHPTTGNGITGDIVYGGYGNADKLNSIDLKGKILLVQQGQVYFYEIVENAASKGALGVIVYQGGNPEIISGTLGIQSSIPAVSINGNDGEKILSALDCGKTVKASIVVPSSFEESTSKNICGVLKNKDGRQETLIIGAHYDSLNSQGANDNASGIAVLMETARILTQKSLNCNVIFIAFGAGESGLLGSKTYVAKMSPADINCTLGMINLDMVGIGDILNIYTENDDDVTLANLAVSCANNLNYAYKRDISADSDHVPFDEAGIPVSYLKFGPCKDYALRHDGAEVINEANLVKACNIVTSLSCYMADHTDDLQK